MTDPRSPLGPGDSHPEEALAAFTDGTATPDERASVLQHLQGCDRCRREVELARGAVAALSSMPEPASPGLDPADIVRRAGNVTEIGGGRRPAGRRRFGAIAGGLVAAAVVAAAFAGIVRLNGNNAATSAGGAMAPSPNAPEAAPSRSIGPVYGTNNQDFTPASIDRLAAAVAANTGGSVPGVSPGKGAADRAASDARTCADQASGGGQVVRILVASFQGHPAFIVVMRADDGGQDVIRVVVTDRTNCSILYTASHPVAG